MNFMQKKYYDLKGIGLIQIRFRTCGFVSTIVRLCFLWQQGISPMKVVIMGSFRKTMQY